MPCLEAEFGSDGLWHGDLSLAGHHRSSHSASLDSISDERYLTPGKESFWEASRRLGASDWRRLCNYIQRRGEPQVLNLALVWTIETVVLRRKRINKCRVTATSYASSAEPGAAGASLSPTRPVLGRLPIGSARPCSIGCSHRSW